MSDTKIHFLQGVCSATLLYPFVGSKALVVGASVVLIDVDHVFEYVHATGRFDLGGIYRLRDKAHEHMDEVIGLNIFHTVECHLVLLFLGLYAAPVFFYILAGFFIHHIFDQIYLIRLGYPFVRAFSILEYLIRSRKHTTMKQLAQRHSV